LTTSEQAEANGYSRMVEAASAGTALSNAGTALLSGSSAQSMVSSIGHAQLLSVIPETGSEMPSMVKKTFINLDSMMFNFDFISLDRSGLGNSLDGAFGSPLGNQTRNLSIIKNKSSVINLLNYILILMFIVTFHILMIIVKYCIESCDKKTKFHIFVDKV
jgi:hypothetical protein